jgi:uncharacterized membrane protein YhhN
MTILLLILFGFAFLDWVAVAIGNRRLEYFAKPATLLILILWFSIQLPDQPPLFSIWFLIGLVLSLIGDIFLMLPEEYFIKGLSAFLLSHVTYVVAFNLTGLFMNLESLIIATVIALITWTVLRRIIDSMRVSGRSSLIIPVIFYAVVLSLMLWSAFTRVLHSDWDPFSSWLIALGGIFFYTADASNAWNRFVGQLPGGRSFEMITYHLSQLILSIGVLLVINGVI